MQTKTFNKTFNRKLINFTKKNSVLRFGHYGIQSCAFGKIERSKITYLIRFLDKYLKLTTSNSKKVKIWDKTTINHTLTKLSSESRMGKGKGSIHSYFTYVQPGQILFEIEKITMQTWNKVFKKVRQRTKLKIKSITKI